MNSKKYKIKAKVWIYQGAVTPSHNAKAMHGSWHFVTIPEKQSNAIKKEFAGGRKALLCVNNDQLKDGELARDLEHHFDLTSVPANTKGRNDLKENDLKPWQKKKSS